MPPKYKNPEQRRELKSITGQSVGERLRVVREDRKRSRRDIGRLVGVGYTAVQKWESGERSIPIEFVRPIAEFLDCEPAWLAGFEGGDSGNEGHS